MVSICIPTYNQTKWLRITLESIVDQTYSDKEIIISDDSTTDDVRQLIEEFRPRIPCELKYFHHQPALGAPANWNFALRQAKGDWIKIVHHDEWFTHDDSLLNFVEHSKNSKFSFCQTEIITAEGKVDWTLAPTESDWLAIRQNPALLILGNKIGAPSATLIHRDALVYFNEELKWLVDIEQYIGILQNTLNAQMIKEPLIQSVGSAEHNITNGCKVIEIDLREVVLLYQRFVLPNTNKWNVSFFKYLVGKMREYDVTTLQELEKVVQIPNQRWYFMLALQFVKHFPFKER